MKAMILAAGFGTRLRPLTDERPKALVPVANRPLMEHNLCYLQSHGVKAVIANAHHLADQIVDYLKTPRSCDLPVTLRVEERILGTGGGIRNTADFWDREPFIVINSDILTDIDLAAAYQAHCDTGAPVTMVLHDCRPFNQVAIDDGLVVRDIAARSGPGRLAFTGIHILDPALCDIIPGSGYADIIAVYRDLIRAGVRLGAHVVRGCRWRDLGTIEAYVAGNRECLAGQTVLLGPHCKIHPSVRFGDWAVIGPRVEIGEGAEIVRSILWEGVQVAARIRITDSIVRNDRRVFQALQGVVY